MPLPHLRKRQSPKRQSRSNKSMQRILDAAAGIFGKNGYESASMMDVARAAGVSKSLLHYHFKSKEHLLIEAQRATFSQIAKRFQARAKTEDTGLQMGLEALDALWESVVELHQWAPFMLETLSMGTQNAATRVQLDRLYQESTALLEESLVEVFGDQRARLTLPPARIAVLIRSALEGLIVELALAKNAADRAIVEQAYLDFRTLFASSILKETP